MKTCASSICSNTSQNGILSWHSLPVENSIYRQKWIELLAIKDLQGEVCSAHFAVGDFLDKTDTLKTTAIPTFGIRPKKKISRPRGSSSRDDDDDDEDVTFDIKIGRKSGSDDNEEKFRMKPTRRAARLAAQKILNTVQLYGLDEPAKPDKEYFPPNECIIFTEHIGLLMECCEEILSNAQRDAFYRAKQAYEDATRRLFYLKSLNAKIINSIEPDFHYDSNEATEKNSTIDPKHGTVCLPSSKKSSEIIITTGKDSGVEVIPKPSPSVKVLYDSRTGTVVGTLPGDTTILSQGGSQTASRIESRTIVQSDKHKQSSSSNSHQHDSNEGTTETKSLQKTLTIVSGGHKMVTTYTLLAVRVNKSDSTTNSQQRVQQAEELKKCLNQQAYRDDAVQWMMKMKMLPEKPQCKWCSMTSLKLVVDKSAIDGYVWKCENSKCAKSCQVVRLPFFGRFGISMSKLLALTYHWVIQSDTSDVVKDVGVDVYTVRSMWRALQEVCGISVALKSQKLGGTNCSVEFGIAQLGRFLIIGVYDRRTGLTRVKAMSVAIGLNIAVFLKTIEPWLHKKSLVISNDPKLSKLGTIALQHVLVKSNSPEDAVHTNNITHYLRTQLCSLFGEFAVNQLKMDTVQGFLDELQWRERYDTSPAECFWNVLKHITDQTGKRGIVIDADQPAPVALLSSTPALSITSARSTSFTSSSSTSLVPSTSIVPKIISDIKESDADINGKRFIKEDGNAANKRLKVSEAGVVLDEFYYGRLGPQIPVTIKNKDVAYQFKCHLCKRYIDNNIKVMNHMLGHIESSRQKNLDLTDLTQCKYCFRKFNTPYSMQCHIEAIHIEKNSLACRICNQAFPEISNLIHHMKVTHVQTEMPYSCSVCQYRSSFLSDVAEHFQQYHYGSEDVMCHYCLKVYRIKFSSSGIGYTQTFYSHLYKHQCKSTKKCSACCLTFINMQDMKNHKLNDHQSMTSTKGVIRLKSTSAEPIIVFEPNKRPIKHSISLPIEGTKTCSIQLVKRNGPDVSALDEKYLSLIVDDDVTDSNCFECKTNIGLDHFNKFVHCGECNYSTNCNKAFVEHVVSCHSGIKKDQNTPLNGKSLKLASPMFCICGFSHSNGNMLALHLSSCQKKSCYPSWKDAMAATIKTEPEREYSECQSAFFPPLVVLDENEEESINESFAKLSAPNTIFEEEENILPTAEPIMISSEKEKPKAKDEKDDRPDMLNALGLIRKKTSLASATPLPIDETSEEMILPLSDDVIPINSSITKSSVNNDLSSDESTVKEKLNDDEDTTNSGHLSDDVTEIDKLIPEIQLIEKA